MDTIQNNVNEAIASLNAIKDKIVEKGVEVAEGTKARLYANKVDDVYKAGQKNWFDNYLSPKTATMGLFAGYGWNDSTFKPTKDIELTGYSPYTFYYCKVTDLVSRLDECGVKMYCGTLSQLQNAFAYSSITTVPYLDLTNCNQYNYIFNNATNLRTITGIKVSEDKAFSGTFAACTSLVDLIIDGTIGHNGFDIHWSTKLSADSLKSIINALSTTTTGLTITLPTTAQANYEAVYGSGSWNVLTATRSNWTIAYA